MFTGNKDVDIEILLYLNDRDLSRFFVINKYTSEFSKNENLWMNLVHRNYGNFLISLKDVKEKYLNGKTWKEYYRIYNNTELYRVVNENNIEIFYGRQNGDYSLIKVGLVYKIHKKFYTVNKKNNFEYINNNLLQKSHFSNPNVKHGLQEKWRYRKGIQIKILEENFKDGKKTSYNRIMKLKYI